MALPEEPVLIDLIRRAASVWMRRGHEIGRRPLVLPNSDFFPDVFTDDEASAAQLVRRLQHHMGMSDIPITTRIYDAEGPPEQASSCSSGACSSPALSFGTPRILEQDDGWLLNVADTEIKHPVALTNNLARGLANIFVLETSREASDVALPLDVTIDITAVALGLGSLLLEGAYIYSKSCGGPAIVRLTSLGVSELAVVFVLFSQIHDQSPRKALALLSATQRAAVTEALDWAGAQRSLFEKLKTEPARFVDGSFELLKEQGLFQRLFRRRNSDEDLLERVLNGELSTNELETARKIARAKPRTPGAPDAHDLGKQSQRDELKALVSDVLNADAE